MTIKPRIALVIPCYNEEESLPHTMPVMAKLHKQLQASYMVDIIFVNDGSKDKTQALLQAYAQKYPFVFYRNFTFNAGHQAAVRAGLHAAMHHDAVITLDADLQHPPELIPQMLQAWQDGAKMVQMLRQDEKGDVSLFKYHTSHLYYRILNGLSDLKLQNGASDFRLIDKSITKVVVESPEKDLFLRGYFSWLKVPSATIEYRPNDRVAGQTKYTFKKMLQLAKNGIIQFSEKPLHIATTVGILFAVVSVAYGIALIAGYLLGNQVVDGWTSLMVVVLFCFGVNFMLLGIVGSYMAHSIHLAKQRPEFMIDTEKLPVFGKTEE